VEKAINVAGADTIGAGSESVNLYEARLVGIY
jgi:hypothetical protein